VTTEGVTTDPVGKKPYIIGDSLGMFKCGAEITAQLGLEGLPVKRDVTTIANYMQ